MEKPKIKIKAKTLKRGYTKGQLGMDAIIDTYLYWDTPLTKEDFKFITGVDMPEWLVEELGF